MANPMEESTGLNPIKAYQDVYNSTPLRLGRNELMILYLLARFPSGLYTSEIYRSLCQERASKTYKPPCINLVQQAILSLKRKGLVIRKRKEGKYRLYLTTRGKKFTLYYTNPMVY